MKVLNVIVTYNSAFWIQKNLNSIYNQDDLLTLDTLIIDNGSTDDTCQIIKDKFPQVKLIESKENLGFAKANNLAFQHALSLDYEYVFLINHDGWLLRDFWENALPVLENYKDFGLLSPYHYDAGGQDYDYGFQRYLATSKNTELNPAEVELINGAFLFISKACLQKTKGFDPLFFFYGEDIDLCIRAKSHGFKIGLIEGANVVHDRKERPMTKEREYYHLVANHLVQFKSIRSGFYSSYFKTLYSASLGMFSKNKLGGSANYLRLISFLISNISRLKYSYKTY
ncbi:glycosyltransferase family 2 protein [Soonwooa sp.]|uniref:glycosyltransferase family 2 protein n=1 Tax=Soonwooa sp. TaxID=1938592 RepID=UPI00289B6391|nr:glycosyltransferase family 2 protein [Soonwooa sp.]